MNTIPIEIVEIILEYADSYLFVAKQVCHSLSGLSSRCVKPMEFVKGCIRDDNLHLIKWMIKNGYSLHTYMIKTAAIAGKLSILKWLYEKNCPCFRPMKYASRGGDIETLEWLLTKGHSLLIVDTVAALYGHQHVIEWFLEKGGTLHYHTMKYATKGGHFELVKWLYDKGCYDSSRVCYYMAIEIQRNDIAEWLKASEFSRFMTSTYQ